MTRPNGKKAVSFNLPILKSQPAPSDAMVWAMFMSSAITKNYENISRVQVVDSALAEYRARRERGEI